VEPVELFSLTDHAALDGRRRIVAAGGQPGLATKGQTLEGQYRCSAGYLLLLTENSPYDEGLHILLLGPDYRLLDEIEVGTSYSPGILSEQTVEGEALGFAMFGHRWRLRVHDSPRRWPGLATPSGARRPLRRLLAPRHLELRCSQGPEPSR